MGTALQVVTMEARVPQSAKVRQLREYFMTEAKGDWKEAAKLCKVKYPAKMLSRVRKEYPQWIAEAELEYMDRMVLKSRELDERLAALARDPTHRDHFKALELVAKLQGRLKEHVVIYDRRQLNNEFLELIKLLKESSSQQAHAIDAQLVEPKA